MKPSSAEFQQSVREIFAALMELPPEEREGAIASKTKDAAVQEEVLELLRFESQSSKVVDKLTPGVSAPPSVLPTVVGYRVTREVGDGASGRVFEAVREEDGHAVAIKVLRHFGQIAGKRSSDSIRAEQERFRREIEIIKRLDHPGIARFYTDQVAETALGGAPCLVMEFVDGQPITAHCDAFDLEDARRIEILAAVCDAVQHAHERGIVHRDLKPANVLVDQTGRPVVVDFGVARVSGVDELETLAQTRQGDLLGTLAYMSPEQAAGRGVEVDGRSDVYSLGVLLFQLLTGRLPLRLAGATLTEALRMIAHEDPLPLVESRPEHSGDLETIVGRALEKERAARYASPAALAADIRHFLAREAILAKPPGSFEQLGRFARRNKGFVAAVAGVLLALLLGLAGLGFGLFQAQANEQLASEREGEARAAAIEFEEIVAILNEVVKAPALEESGYDVRVSELLGELSLRLEKAQAWGEPKLAELHLSLARSFASLGLPGQSALHFESAIRAQDHGGVIPANRASVETQSGSRLVYAAESELDSVGKSASTLERAELLLDLGEQLESSDRSSEAIDAYRKARKIRSDVQGVLDATVFEVDTKIAFSLRSQGRYQEGRELIKMTHAQLQEQLGANAIPVHYAEHVWAAILMELSEWESAEELQANALSGLEANPDCPPKLLQNARNNLALILRSAEKTQKAVTMYRTALEQALEMHGPNHKSVYHLQQGLGVSLKHLDEFDEAFLNLDAAAKGLEGIHGLRHKDSLIARENLALWYYELRRFDEAIEIQSEVVNLRDELGIGSSHDLFRSYNSYGSLLYVTGEYEAAMIWLGKAAKIAGEKQSGDAAQLIVVESNLAQAMIHASELEDGVALLESVIERMPNSELANTTREFTIVANFGWALTKTGNPEEALPFLARAVGLGNERLPKGAAEHVKLRGFYGEALMATGQLEEAREVFLEARALGQIGQVQNPDDQKRIEDDIVEVEKRLREAPIGAHSEDPAKVINSRGE